MLAIAAGLVAAGLALWQVASGARKYALRELETRSGHTLNLIVANLRGELSKHQYQPRVLARIPKFVDAAAGRLDPGELQAVNEELERLADVSGALDIYLMDARGTTVAASNWSLPRSFVGRNFGFRPYFKDAMNGILGRFYAVGTTSGERGYYFASAIRSGSRIVGVVAVKIQVGQLEGKWRSPGREVMVAGSNNVVFLSTNPAWLLTALNPLGEAEIAHISETRRYAGRTLGRLPIAGDGEWPAPGRTVRLWSRGPPTAGGARNSELRTYISVERPMPDAGWKVILLADTRGTAAVVNLAVVIAVFVLATFVLAGVNIAQRRRRLSDRIALQDRINAHLESRVQERTQDLVRANDSLRIEIAERGRAEKELRETQSELIQTAKLAALGQMSAGISHELNQPLAAIRSYADNAAAYLDKGKPETARSNLAAIGQLTERMARIIRHLRTFARKERPELKPTDLHAAIGEALELMDRNIKGAGVHVAVDHAPDLPPVMAGDVRLQQVIVNLLSNAIDAMEHSLHKTIRIRTMQEDGQVQLTIRDSGPGIDSAKLENLFDPFFTTKAVGKGLGLGLSITYGIVKEFGGRIDAANHPEGGAVFDIRLKAAVSADRFESVIA